MKVVYITNGNVRAGILPGVGGRIVSLQRDNGANILESDPALWDEEDAGRITPTPFTEFKPYNGHEVWVGPQSQWWKHQTLNPEKINSTLFWPPDPYISYDNYTILEQSTSSITIEGGKSPISGVQFTKKITIDDKGKLRFEVTARNIREEAIAWDLWLITRVNGHNPNFAPVASPEEVRLTDPSHPYQGRAPYKIEDGFFSFTPEKIDGSREEYTGKAIINPLKSYMATLAGDNLLIIRFEKQNPADIHPEQGEVEFYSFATAKRETSLLEIEFHAPYKTLQPGESMSAWEEWEIHPFSENATDKEIRGFLKESLHL